MKQQSDISAFSLVNPTDTHLAVLLLLATPGLMMACSTTAASLANPPRSTVRDGARLNLSPPPREWGPSMNNRPVNPAIEVAATRPGPAHFTSEVHAADGAWGRMIRLVNGQWLSVATGFQTRETHALRMKISADNARTWKPLSAVIEPGRKMDNGELIQLPNRSVLLTGRSLIDGESYHLPVYQSVDDGAHWTLLSMIDENDHVVHDNKPPQGLWEPHFFLLGDGRLAVAYANEKHSVETPSFSQVCSERVSDDNGATWGPEKMVVEEPGGGHLRPGMPVVTRMKNGHFIEVSEIVGLGNADVFYKTSPDGVNWSAGLGDPIPMQHAGPWVTSLLDGRLMATSCSNEISYSDDFGKTWRHDPAPPWNIGFAFSFPAIYQTGSHEIAVMNTYHGVNIRFQTISGKNEG